MALLERGKHGWTIKAVGIGRVHLDLADIKSVRKCPRNKHYLVIDTEMGAYKINPYPICRDWYLNEFIVKDVFNVPPWRKT